jgi:hypothetical protein
MASMTPAPVKTALGSGGGMGEPSPGGATVGGFGGSFNQVNPHCTLA